jgi:hypothetical protein
VKLPRIVGASIQSKLRCFRSQDNLDTGNRAMLGIVSDAAYGTENRGESWESGKEEN